MTTLVSARELATELFDSLWNDRTPVVYGNDNAGHDKGLVAWVRMTVSHAPVGGQETLGPVGQRRFQRNAIAQVEIRSPVNQGKAAADALTHAARGIFEGKTYQGLYFGDAQARELGQDGRWDVTLVEAEFFYEERK